MDDEFAGAKPEPDADAPPAAESPTVPSLRSSPDVTAPIVVDLGGRRRKEIKELKRGEGPLVAEVGDVVEQVRAALAELDGKTLVPVVLVYKKKRKRTRQATTRVIPRS
jgi:uncharacterized protein DUF6200